MITPSEILNLSMYNRRALLGGTIAALITGIAAYVLGNISGYEAKQLIGSSLPGINMLCNTVVLASATILALLLTLLGISASSESTLEEEHYIQVSFIAKWDTVLFISAIIMFQLFNIPITEADTLPTSWFAWIYWSTLFTSSLLSGGLVVIILMLYNTVSNMIKIIGLGQSDHPLTHKENADG